MTFSKKLNVDVTTERLREMYGHGGENYYWYLKSDAFKDACLRPLAARVNALGLPCLDVGCGEGWLSEFITVPYAGFDASVDAIETARRLYPEREFFTARFESFDTDRRFGTIILGGILSVMVCPEDYIELLEHYAGFGASYLVIYDLTRLDTSVIEQRFRLVEAHFTTVDLPELEEVKRLRKIMVFACS